MMNKEMLIKDYMEYLNTLGKTKETQRSYKTCVNRFLNDIEIEDEKEFETMSTEFFLDYANSLREEISVATINKHMKQLSSFYQYLMFKGISNNNPCYKFPKLNNNNSEYKERVMSDEQAKAILKATDSFKQYNFKNALRDKTIIFLMLNIAPRISEVSKIRLEDLAFENDNRIYIRGKGGNNKVTRYSNVNNITKGLIIQLIQQNKGGIYLFENYKGERLSEGSIRKIWYYACKLASVKGFSPHSVRHYVGSSLVAKEVDLKKVAFVLGHSNIGTTQKYYIRPKDNLGEIIDVIDIF